LSEGRKWFGAVLAGSHTLPAALRARALNGAGRLALRQGLSEYASARAMFEESLSLWRGVADRKGEMQALNSLGLVGIFQNDMPQAQSYFDQSLEAARRLGDKQGMMTALNNLGLSLRYQQQFDRAVQSYEECLAFAREMNYTFSMSAALHNLGHLMHDRGDDARAHPLLVESLLLGRQLRLRPSISWSLADLAGVWAAQGQPKRAARLFGAAEAMRENIQVIMYEAQRLAYQRDVDRATSQLDAATWKAAWAEGRTMSLDDACALAIEELPPSPLTPQSDFNLTDRELEVLRLLVSGLTYAQIAEQLTLSFHTVHAHLRVIYRKLGVTSRSQATRFATEQGLA
jgi:non-specific serine/threonine protein kinase